MSKNKKLGRGLSALFSNKDKNPNNVKEFKILNISSLVANKNQPRKNFDHNEIKNLAESIKSQGVLQPIIARKKNENEYEIVAGERRWRAAQIAGLHEIPTIVKDFSDKKIMEIALIENIQRENLNPVEEAKAYKVLTSNNKINQDELAALVGKSRSHISNIMRLLELDEKILELIVEGKLSMGHARTLIGVPNAFDFAKEIIKKNLSVRDIEKTTSKYKSRSKKNNKNTKDPNIADLEKELSNKIGLRTEIEFSENGSSGSLKLYYSDLNQLDEIMKRLKK